MRQPDATLRELTGYRLRRVTHVTGVRVRERLAVFGLRRTTFAALTLIVETPGLQQGKLAEALAIEGTNLVKILDDLEQAGLIRRDVAPGDRRIKALTPTAPGRQRLAEARVALRDLDQQLTDGLTAAQIDRFQAALDLIERNATPSIPEPSKAPT